MGCAVEPRGPGVAAPRRALPTPRALAGAARHLPRGPPGYLAWQRSLYTRQAGRARELLLSAGIEPSAAAEVATWVAKEGLRSNPGTQALEDAACLVFLENEIGAFAAAHADYPREKFIEILRKTWRKMSPAAHAAALGLELPPAIAELVRAATAVPTGSPSGN